MLFTETSVIFGATTVVSAAVFVITPEDTVLPDVSDTDDCNVTLGVALADNFGETVRVTTVPFTLTPVTVVPATVKSDVETEEESMFAVKVTSILVSEMTFAEDIANGIESSSERDCDREMLMV